jgi:hypothetical protein
MYLAVPTTRSGKGTAGDALDLEPEEEEPVESGNGAKSKKK